MPTKPGTDLSAIRPLPEMDPVANPDAVVEGEGWRITVLTEALFRVEWSSDGGFEDRASTFAIRRSLPACSFTVTRIGGGVTITTPRARLQYDGQKPCSNGLSVELLKYGSSVWRYGDHASNLGGTTRTLDEVDGRIELDPGIVSRAGVSLIDDSTSFLFDDEGWIGTRVGGRYDLYIFAYGHDIEGSIKALYQISGPPTRLPRWAFGNWWSRYYEYSASEYLDLMDRFASENLPFSVAVIDMDWHRVGSVPPEYGTGWTGYSWEKELFPDPAGFLGELHRRGLHTTLNLHPADGIRAFEDRYVEMAEALGRDPKTEQAIGFSATDPDFLRAYFEVLHHPLEEEGVDFWWIDWQQGRQSDLEGVDPLWVLNHFHYLDACRPGGSGMVFSRYGGPGSHRYAVGFSGDAAVTWDSLEFQPEFTATAANIGYPWWSHDIGGHMWGVHDDELQTRWIQFGVFSPILRLHSSNNPFIRKEPWLFGGEYREAMNDALRLRHRLIPYLYTANYQVAEGVALVRPVYHVYPARSEAYTVPNEYMFGSELLVAPIVTPRDSASLHAVTRSWLPPGTWTDIFTGVVYRGDRYLMLHRGLSSIPVLLRSGGIVPLACDDELDANTIPSCLEVLIAPTSSGSFNLIEDSENTDGSETQTESKQTEAKQTEASTRLSWDSEAGEFVIDPVKGNTEVVPNEREWKLTFFSNMPTSEVLVDGKAAQLSGKDGRWNVTVRSSTAVKTIVKVGQELTVGPDETDLVTHVLERAQAGNAAKLEAWHVLQSELSSAEKIAALEATGLPDSVRGVITELLGSIHSDSR